MVTHERPSSGQPADFKRDPAGWVDASVSQNGDMIVRSMGLAGVEELFFCSGSDIVFLQEAIAKAHATGQATPRIVTVMHEAVALAAACGVAAVARRPSATAVHVEVGTLNYGASLHTAYAEQLPILMISGSPARAYPGSMPGARDNLINWVQEQEDQRALVRDYSKWRFRLEAQDNAGLVVSRALQVAQSPPKGPAFLSIPREIGMLEPPTGAFPTVEQLGIARPGGPEPAAIEELAEWLLAAERPLIVTGRSGRDPETVALLVRVAELVGAPVTDNLFSYALNFPANHALFGTGPAPAEADMVLVLDRRVPWVPGRHAPGPPDDEAAALPPYEDPADLAMADPRRAPGGGCRVAWLSADPIVSEVPLLELPGQLRIASDPRLGLQALADCLSDRITPAQRERARERLRTAAERKRMLKDRNDQRALAARANRPIDPAWAAYQLGRAVDDEAILMDETLGGSVKTYCRGDRPNSYFSPEGTGGGWGPGAALGAKLADPERDVILTSGDGFYTYGSPLVALWSAARYAAPYLTVVFVNARYSTGTSQLLPHYPDGYAVAAGFPGGRFDPPPDFAAEAAAAGAYGVSVEDPHELSGELERALAATRAGQPAVVAVRVA